MLDIKTSQKKLFPAGLKPATFRVLGGCDNHYTTETTLRPTSEIFNFLLVGIVIT